MAFPIPSPMDRSLAEQQWQLACTIEADLRAKLNKKDPLFDVVETLIQDLRIACELAILTNFEFAASKNVETHLWDVHGLINSRYRKILSNFKSDERQKFVEKRKWQKRYADFIKSSQYFYKCYIQRLAYRFRGRNGTLLLELRKIAHQLDPTVEASAQQIIVSDNVAHAILLSCHATLLHLGDLSRYRNEIRTKNRSWDVAMQYYGLANELCPKSGSAFNQMAVIALADSNHLDAVYYLYRSLAIEEPHPVGRKNLEIEFKKITSEWEKEKGGRRLNPRQGNSARSNNLAPLISWFVRLHAKLYKGEDFAGHDELENEVLSQMTLLLKEQSLESTMDKLVLINIAAEYFAGERLKDTQNATNFQSFYFFLRLNVRTLFMLLQLLQPELEAPQHEDDDLSLSSAASSDRKESVSAVARRILPALRFYSTWLTSRVAIIASQSNNHLLDVHVKQLWQMYSSTLTMLVHVYPVDQLPVVGYLLEEDQETVGFKPFRDELLAPNCDIYINETGIKPRMTDPGISRSHPNTEMLARIRELLKDGVTLACGDECPVKMVNGQFYYAEDGLPVSNSVNQSRSRPAGESDTVEAPVSAQLIQSQNKDSTTAPSVAASDSHHSLGPEAHRMVDDLLDGFSDVSRSRVSGRSSNKTSKRTKASTESSSLQASSSRRSFTSEVVPQPLASLPGIYSSPFTPRPHELPSSSPDRPRSSREMIKRRSGGPQQSPDPLSMSRGLSYDDDYVQNLWGVDCSIETPRQTSKQGVMDDLQSSLLQSFQQTSLSPPAFNPSNMFSSTLSPPTTDYRNNAAIGGRMVGSYQRQAMLNDSPWNDRHSWTGQVATPPGGQGG